MGCLAHSCAHSCTVNRIASMPDRAELLAYVSVHMANCACQTARNSSDALIVNLSLLPKRFGKERSRQRGWAAMTESARATMMDARQYVLSMYSIIRHQASRYLRRLSVELPTKTQKSH